MTEWRLLSLATETNLNHSTQPLSCIIAGIEVSIITDVINSDIPL